MAHGPQRRPIQPGDDVYSADGEKFGVVGAVTSTYLMVEQGFFFPTDYYIPLDAVASAARGRVRLAVTKEQALQQGWEIPPSREPAPVTTFTRGENYTIDDNDTVAVPVYEEDLTVTKTARAVGGVRIDKRLLGNATTLNAPVTELRLMVVRRAVARPGDAAGAEVLEEVIVDLPLTDDAITPDRQSRFIEEIAVRKEVFAGVERVSHPVRHEEVRVTDVTTGAVITEHDQERVLRAPR